MTEGSFVPLAGSKRESLSGVQDAGPVDASERIEVTLVLRRRAELPAELVIGPDTISTEELATSYGTVLMTVSLIRRSRFFSGPA